VSGVDVSTGLWAGLEREIATHPAPDDGGLWSRLADRMDPAEWRPKLAEDVELRVFRLRWGNDYAMMANPRDLVHYTLSPEEAEIARLMDGTRSIKDIVVERLESSGDLDLDGVVELAQSLYVGNFLERQFFDLDAAVRRAITPESTARRKGRQFAKTLSIEWENADRLVSWFYRNGLKWFFTRPLALVSVAIAVAGFISFLFVVGSHRFSLSGQSLALGVLILMGLNYFLTFCHELGHAVVLTHYGRRVKSAGFMIYFGSPAFFVESADVLMLDRPKRILQAFGGPLAEAIVAGTASVIVLAFPEWFLSPTLYTFAVLNYFVLFMNLVPLLELDGYFILSDLIQVPDLRPRSLQFVRYDLWHKLRKREALSRPEVGLALYGTLGIAFTIFSLYTAFFFWEEIFGGLVSKLWHGGVVTRVLLVVLALIIAGPLVRGFVRILRSLWLRVRAQWRRLRFKTELRWRVEAAEMVDALPVFGDIPVEALNDLAGRVRIRTFGAGQPVVRQGDPAEAFYVVRRGTLQVVEEDRDAGNERGLRTLTRGESFGELALVRGSPRTATVRAEGEAEVFEVDRATFDRLLAGMITVPEFMPTLQQFAELHDLSCFAELGDEQLAELLEHGEWRNIAPGVEVVEQGATGDAFYAIAGGQVQVEKDGEVVKVLGPGAHFGEIALLMDVPRTATVRARTPLRVFRLDRSGFDTLIADAFRKGALYTNLGVNRIQRH